MEYVVGAPKVSATRLKLSENTWVCPDAFVPMSATSTIAVTPVRVQITPKEFFVLSMLGAGWSFIVCGWKNMFLNKEREW
jgi:hypothetical protein